MSHNLTQKQTVAWLLHHSALKMLAESPIKGKVRESAQSLYNQLRAHESAEHIAGVNEIASILTGLIRALAACQDTTQFGLIASYIKAIEKGDVMIAEPEQLRD